MKGAASALFLFLPTIACAGDSSGHEFSFIASFLQMIAALAIVISISLPVSAKEPLRIVADPPAPGNPPVIFRVRCFAHGSPR